jgi:hypothetical protein
MYASFEISAIQDAFEGALLFRLQRHSDKEYDMDTSDTETNNDKTKHVYILVAWKVKDAKPFVHVVLVEHTNEFIWNEDELGKLYYQNRGWFKEYSDIISDTWFMDNNMALKTSSKIGGLKGNFELSTSISEEERDYAMRPLNVDLER